MTDGDYLAQEMARLTAPVSLEASIGRAGAEVFRAAYNALAEEGTEEDPEDTFAVEHAVAGASAVVRAWPSLVTMPNLPPMGMTPPAPEEEEPNTMALPDGTEVIRLQEGSKVFVSRIGDEFTFTLVGDTLEGKATKAVGTIALY